MTESWAGQSGHRVRAGGHVQRRDDDVPVTPGTYFGSLAKALGLEPPRFLPGWVTPLFGSVGEAMARSLRLSNRKLRNVTGWAPRFASVRDGWPAMLAQMDEAVRARRNPAAPAS